MKYNVLVIAGTTESRQVIEKLLGENPNRKEFCQCGYGTWKGNAS